MKETPRVRDITDRPDEIEAPFTSGRVALVLALAVCGISTASVLVRLAGDTGLGPLTVAGVRMALAAALFVPVTPMRDFFSLRRGDTLLLGFSGLCLAVHFGAWTWSLYLIPVARSVLLVDTQPIFVTLLAALLLGERPERRAIGFIATAILGVVIMFAGEAGGGNLAGDLLALLGAIAAAGYVLAGRRLRRSLGVTTYVVGVYATSATLLLIAAGLRGEDPTHALSLRATLLLVGLAVLPTLCGHTLMNWALAHVPSRVVSTAFLAEAPGAALLALLILGETPDERTIAGGAVCLLGVAGVVVQRRRVQSDAGGVGATESGSKSRSST